MDRTEEYSELEITSLALHMTWASVEMIADDMPVVQVLLSGDEDSVSAAKLSVQDGVLRIYQSRNGLPSHLMSSRRLQVLIRVPLTWKGMVEASTTSGELRVRRLSGTDFRLKTVKGSIEAEQLGAISLKVSSLTGRISMDEVQAGKLHLKNRFGDIVGSHLNAQDIHLSGISSKAVLQLNSAFDLLEAVFVTAQARIVLPVSGVDASIHTLNGRLLTENVSIREEGPVLSVLSLTGNMELICQQE